MNAQLLPIFPEPIVEYKNLGVDQGRVQRLYDEQVWESTNAEDNPENFLKISKNLRVLEQDAELRQTFLNIVDEYAEKFMLYKNKFFMTTSWFTKTERDKISILHNHGNSMFSAVYYFGLSNGRKSKITFEKPVTSQIDLKPTAYNAINGPSYVFEMGNDTLLIFPSYLKHKVNRHDNAETRKSLAMNFMPQGILGAGTNEIWLSGPSA